MSFRCRIFSLRWELKLVLEQQGSANIPSSLNFPLLCCPGDSSSQQHLRHTNVLVLQEPGEGGPVPGCRRCRSGGEDQTAHRERPRKRRGLRHSQRIREWTTFPAALCVEGINVRFHKIDRWMDRQCYCQLEDEFLECVTLRSWFSSRLLPDGPHAFRQQSGLRVPQRERRLWLRQLLKQRLHLLGVRLWRTGTRSLHTSSFIPKSVTSDHYFPDWLLFPTKFCCC